jgi:hypothetical protein
MGMGPARFQELYDRYPEFAADYTVHVSKMTSSRLSVRVKNPQLRIHANKLRSEERQFGFRQCAFHSHRKSVGERQCPHVLDEEEEEEDDLVPPVPALPVQPHLPAEDATFALDLPPPPSKLTLKQERRRQVVINTMFAQDMPQPLRRMNSVLA